MTSLRDTLTIARFELLRALRTWRALSLVAVYLIATAGGAWIFTRIVGALERELAGTLGVAATDTPGAMMSELVRSGLYRQFIEGMVGAEHLDAALSVPVLAVFHLWISFIFVPFFAGTAAAECVSVDVSSRAIRYEALRTGRLEIALGRYAGQLALTGLASAVGLLGTWTVGVGFMVGNPPGTLLLWLVIYTLRAWFFAMPAIGFGAAVSQVFDSPAWSRVVTLVGVVVAWIAYGFALEMDDVHKVPLLSAVILPLIPQGWMSGLWAPGAGWLTSALACAALGLAWVTLGGLRFSARDL